jgi:hypothetical protein
MAIVKCPDCAKVYDDFYRWTRCPHETFQLSASAAADPQVIEPCTEDALTGIASDEWRARCG